MSTYTTSGACIQKAGGMLSGAYLGTAGEGNWETLILNAEATVNCAMRKDLTDATDWAGTASGAKLLISDVTSSLATIYAITSNFSGYSRIIAEDMLNVLRDTALRGISILRDKKTQDFIDAA